MNMGIMLQLDSSTDSSIYISKTKMNRPMAYETFFTQDNLPNILAKSDDWDLERPVCHRTRDSDHKFS